MESEQIDSKTTYREHIGYSLTIEAGETYNKGWPKYWVDITPHGNEQTIRITYNDIDHLIEGLQRVRRHFEQVHGLTGFRR